MTRSGFPHSDIRGSTPACGSPRLIAANHVLHRLLTPRHSPSALSSLTTNLSVSADFAPPCGVKAKVRSSSLPHPTLAFASAGLGLNESRTLYLLRV